MKRYSFNQGTLIFNGNTITFEIPSNMHQIDPSVNQQFLVDPWSFSTELEFTDDGLKLIYQVEQGFFTFERARVQFMRDTKLNIAVNLIRIGEYFQSQGQLGTVFQPANFFADGFGNVKMMYRGLLNSMPNWGFTDEPVFEQIKRLILLLFSSAKFDELRFNGHAYANQKLLEDFKRVGKRILQTQSFEEMDHVLKKEYEELLQEEKEQSEKQPPPEKSSFLTIFTPKPVTSSPNQVIRPQNAQQQQTKENRNIMFMMIGMGILLVIYIGMQMFSGTDNKAENLPGPSQTSSKEEESKKPQPGKSISVNEHLYNALVYYGAKEYDKASKEFDQLQTNDLPKEEKKIAYYTYYRMCEVDKAIKLFDSKIGDMVEDCFKEKKMDKFLQSKSTHYEVLFAKALANQNVDEMIEILQKNKVVNEFKGKRVIDLLVQKNKSKEAIDFAANTKMKTLIDYVQLKTKR